MAPFELDFKDSNIAGIGSDLDEGLRRAAANTEEQFDGAGEKVGLEVWRIEKFDVERQSSESHGQFYSGDAYIVLNTYTSEDDSDVLMWDIHFFLGKDSTQDEKGTAAYMTVCLDDKLGGKPVQYREVEGAESKKFRSYFPVFRTMEGGIDSGFKSVEPESYTPRLFQIYGPSNQLTVKQVPMTSGSLNKSDVFILDAGLKLYQWNTSNSSPFERMRASQVREKIQAERDGVPQEVIIEGDEINDVPQVWEFLGEQEEIAESAERASDDDDDGDVSYSLYSISDSTGKMETSLVSSGDSLSKSDLDEDNINLVVAKGPARSVAYFSAGAKSSRTEQFYVNFTADDILDEIEVPRNRIAVMVKPGVTNADFEKCFE